ncbi:extracellular cell surface DNA-entry nuclease precursor [Companilactobacillus kimchiensis]|uniref:Extracellular cell surface DNA-entry nuclease n=1 Tax=Companilactobacillus kimchiensis TaxID=993692 RepID=A0A0R2LG24_9LACO|nr:extracellular cell surface DNA-entry nuclease precursor [Companilactobacillus kimchiensis]
MTDSNKTTTESTQVKKQKTVSKANLSEMSNWTYQSGDNPVKILNDDQPTTLTATDFSTSRIDYSSLDSLNRTGTATAYLTRNNLGKSKTRTEQVWKPTGWHNEPKQINGERVIPQNRGHLIAYTMTFNLNDNGKTDQGHLGSINNPYNLFTQTAFSNQKTMTETEQLVRTALAQNKKVIYQVTPIFHGDDLMARGVWVQALSTDGTLKFNRYLWNVQSKIQFDYATGRSQADNNFEVAGDDGRVQVVNSQYQNRNHHKRYYHHKNNNSTSY